jgi:hypothetical protein
MDDFRQLNQENRTTDGAGRATAHSVCLLVCLLSDPPLENKNSTKADYSPISFTAISPEPRRAYGNKVTQCFFL